MARVGAVGKQTKSKPRIAFSFNADTHILRKHNPRVGFGFSFGFKLEPRVWSSVLVPGFHLTLVWDFGVQL